MLLAADRWSDNRPTSHTTLKVNLIYHPIRKYCISETPTRAPILFPRFESQSSWMFVFVMRLCYYCEITNCTPLRMRIMDLNHCLIENGGGRGETIITANSLNFLYYTKKGTRNTNK